MSATSLLLQKAGIKTQATSATARLVQGVQSGTYQAPKTEYSTAQPTQPSAPAPATNDTFSNIMSEVTKVVQKYIPQTNPANKPIITPIENKPIVPTANGPKMPVENLNGPTSSSAKFTQNAIQTPQAQKILKSTDKVINKIDEYYQKVQNTPDSLITKAQNKIVKSASQSDFKLENDKILNSLSSTQKFVETNPVFVGELSPFSGLEKSVSGTFLGSSDKVKEALYTRLPQKKTVAGKVIETAGQIVGGLASYYAGGVVIKNAGFAKATLPILFSVLGQTSSPKQTTLEQRISRMPIDTITGYILSALPGGANPFTVKGQAQALASGTIGGVSTFITELTQGMNKKDAASTALKAAVTFYLLHMAFTAANPTVRQGKLELTPEEARTQADSTNLRDTRAGEVLKQMADQAESENRVIEITQVETKDNPAVKAIKNILSKQKGGMVVQDGQTYAQTPGGTVVTFKIGDVVLNGETPGTTSAPATAELKAPGSTTPAREVIKLDSKPEGVDSAIAIIKPDGTAGMNVMINPTAQKNGLGTQVVKELESKLLAKGVSQVSISAFTESQGFWKKQGYSVVPGTPEKPGMIPMQKTLQPTQQPTKESLQPQATAKTVPSNDVQGTKNTNQIKADTLAGKREDQRLNTPENIYKAGTALGIKDAKPTDTVTVYRGGIGEIKPGDFVTTDKAVAQDYLTKRPGAQILQTNAQVQDLTLGSIKKEFIYAPIQVRRITARDLVELKNKKEISQKLDTIFGTEKELQAIDDKLLQDYESISKNSPEKTGVTREEFAKLDVANKYRADLERAIIERNYEETSILLKSVRKETTKKENGPPAIRDIIATKKVALTKPTISAKQANENLATHLFTTNPDQVNQALSEVFTEMDVAEAGYRILNKETGAFEGAVSSTFPSWVPDELRHKDLFQKVLGDLGDIANMQYPPNSQPRKQALYDAIFQQIDARAGTNTLKYIDQIKEAYARETKQKETAKTVDRSAKRSKSTAGPKGAEASIGKYTGEAPRTKQTIENLHIIEFPEMVALARELTGKVPRVVKMRNANRQGDFNPLTQAIRLNRDIFTDEKQVAATLAHEIGHLVDFLETTEGSGTMKRGNLLGRLATLQSYRKFFISDEPPAESNLITPKDREALRKEAKRLAGNPTQPTQALIIGERSITPEEVLSVWRDVKIGTKDPDLLKYIQTLADNQKVEIVKSALKGVLPKWVNFTKVTENGFTAATFRKAPEEIRKIYKKLLEEEIIKRRLVSLEVVREELRKLSYDWRPIGENPSAALTAYRNSGKELYADAISVLFNDPLRLQQDAPVFYRTFFNYLTNKPLASEAFFDAQHLLNQGEDKVLKSRLENIDKMFTNDEAKFTAMQLERAQSRRDIMFELKYELVDKNQKVLDKVKEAQKRGVIIPDDENPKYALDGYNYLAGKIKAFLEEHINPWYSKLADQGLTWEDMGKMMFLQRVSGERAKVANPLGLTPKTAKATLDKMREKLGPEKTAALEKAIDQFRAANKLIMKNAYTNGQLYTDEMYQTMSANDTYASFRVTDYIDKNVTAKIYKQVGTLKDIGNPATQTLAKMIATIRATERSQINRTLVKFLQGNFPKEIEQAKMKWNGRTRVPVEPTDGRGIIYVLDHGKTIAFYVDPFIASTVDRGGIQNLNILLRGFQLSNAKLFRPIFTGVNLGFQLRNFRRDIIRLYKAQPGLSLVPIMRGYMRALGPAKARALGQIDKTILEMEKKGMLSVTYNDIIKGRSEEDKQIDDIFHRYIGQSEPGTKNPILKVAEKILGAIEIGGNFVETLPKVAGYLELSDKMKPQELADFVRTKSGSPDFLRRGNSAQATNNVFLFSNAAKEGFRGDYEAFTNPKTASGYWFKTFLIDFLPKILMKMAVLGVFGTFVKRMYDNMSEYTKTNYNPLAIAVDKNGKTVFAVTGSDESGQLFGGLFWKALNINTDKSLLQGFQDILAFSAGRLPGLNPAISAQMTAMQYLEGQNPYDQYRNRNVLTDEQYKAGGMYSFVPFIQYEFQSLGGSIIMGQQVVENTPNQTILEKVLNLPVASNVLQSLIRVSDYGQTEKNRQIGKQATSTQAAQHIDDMAIVDKYVQKFQFGGNKNDLEKQLIKDVQNNEKLTPELQNRLDSVRAAYRLSIVKGTNDPNIKSLVNAQSNVEKIAILKRLKSEMTSGEYDTFGRLAVQNKVISAETFVNSKR